MNPDHNHTPTSSEPSISSTELTEQVKIWARELGFHGVGIASIDIGHQRPRLEQWLELGYQGEMEFMEGI